MVLLEQSWPGPAKLPGARGLESVAGTRSRTASGGRGSSRERRAGSGGKGKEVEGTWRGPERDWHEMKVLGYSGLYLRGQGSQEAQ